MDRNDVIALSNEDIRAMTDKELVAARALADGVVSYESDFEALEEFGTIAFDAAIDFGTRGISRIPGVKDLSSRAGLPLTDTEEEIGELFELNSPDGVAAVSTIQAIDSELEGRAEGPFRGPDDGSRPASYYDGNPSNDGEDPNITLADARRMTILDTDEDP